MAYLVNTNLKENFKKTLYAELEKSVLSTCVRFGIISIKSQKFLTFPKTFCNFPKILKIDIRSFWTLFKIFQSFCADLPKNSLKKS